MKLGDLYDDRRLKFDPLYDTDILELDVPDLWLTAKFEMIVKKNFDVDVCISTKHEKPGFVPKKTAWEIM